MHARRYFISVTMVVVYAVESQSGRSAGAAAIYSRGGGFYKPSFMVFVVGGPGNNVARHISSFIIVQGWLGSRVVSELDSGAEGPGFKSQPRRCRITVLGKLFTPIVLLFTKQRNW